MSMVELTIAGRNYEVRCRDGEEDSLRKAGALVDEKCREALAGLGTLSESRQFFFASLLLADQMLEKQPEAAPPPPPAEAQIDAALLERAEGLVTWLESLANGLESEGQGA
ncbi:cell division protein ZapA [Sphingomicrobium lutaoense]|uniref:Cell division protein ZapA n=1 Tax=Sphingomicrobium lutaoense TaxID=515949 RepID=A0A839Z001_9SPHN|nr:cell division protein ZapA [Sphingomicrobium lutaoense]MBB3763898.1 cell division protein ZapA [Sphingomicrobium lutaoense]